MSADTAAARGDGKRHVLQVICGTCGDTPRVVDMAVIQRDEVIVLSAARAIVISLDEQAATTLFDVLGAWLG